MNSFAPPSVVPQDLQHIQDLLGPIAFEPPKKATVNVVDTTSGPDSDIESSSSEQDSEDEVEDVLMPTMEEDEAVVENVKEKVVEVDTTESKKDSTVASHVTEDIIPESDDSDTESDASSTWVKKPAQNTEEQGDDLDEDGERSLGLQTQHYYTSQNEVLDAEINIPSVEELVDEKVVLVGQVENILNGNTVIVKGVPTSTLESSQHALDSDTLLVFDDLKVLGYIYETFGPTAQPFYQVRFNSKYPLDTEKVTIGRHVFHAPTRSHVVPLSQLLAMRGSDASNVFDEEPGDHELEFSDDEAEAEHKRKLKNARRGDREGSVASSSRYGTPARTYSDAFGANSAYDDPSGSSSRSAPIPYDDDPYSDSFGAGLDEGYGIPQVPSRPRSPVSAPSGPTHRERPPTRGRGRGQRGRGAGRGGMRSGPSPQPQLPMRHSQPVSYSDGNHHDVPHYNPAQPSFGAPLPFGFQFNPSNPGFNPNNQFNPNFAWQQQQQQQQQQQHQAMVQPHINPRFFAMNMGGYGVPPQMPYTQNPPQHQHYWNGVRPPPPHEQGPPSQ